MFKIVLDENNHQKKKTFLSLRKNNFNKTFYILFAFILLCLKINYYCKNNENIISLSDITDFKGYLILFRSQ